MPRQSRLYASGYRTGIHTRKGFTQCLSRRKSVPCWNGSLARTRTCARRVTHCQSQDLRSPGPACGIRPLVDGLPLRHRPDGQQVARRPGRALHDRGLHHPAQHQRLRVRLRHRDHQHGKLITTTFCLARQDGRYCTSSSSSMLVILSRRFSLVRPLRISMVLIRRVIQASNIRGADSLRWPGQCRARDQSSGSRVRRLLIPRCPDFFVLKQLYSFHVRHRPQGFPQR